MPIRRSKEAISVKNSSAWAIIEFCRAETCNCYVCPVHREEDGRKKTDCRKCERRLKELEEFCGGGKVDDFSD